MELNTAQDFHQIDRHKTAIPRAAVSAPVFLLQSGGLITPGTTVLDYGCGKGGDVQALREANIDACGWDPHYAPNPTHLKTSDVVNLGFVLNVIENVDERAETLRTAFGYARKCLAVSVMLVGKGDLSNARPFKDGILTSRRTFQKYYSQAEIRDFIKDTLDLDPIAARPGIFFAFRDEVEEQRYLLRRQVGFHISVVQAPRIKETKRPAKGRKLGQTEQKISSELADLIRELGRNPDESELPIQLAKSVKRSRHALPYYTNHALKEIEPAELERVVAERTEELSLYFALNMFSQRKPYGQLPRELQRDVRAFFSSHQRALSEGKALLFSIGDQEQLRQDASDASQDGIGYLEEDKFQFHVNDLQRLSIRLRGYVAIAERLAGDLSDATLLRVHIASRKLSALHYPDFDQSPLPRLTKRIKVEFPTFNVSVVDHAKDNRVRLLYLRSRYLYADHSHFEAQKTFDDALSRLQDLDFTGEGPDFRSFSEKLQTSGVQVPKL